MRAERVMRLAKANHLVDLEETTLKNSVNREIPDEIFAR